jgi:acyl carrier protein
VTPEEVVSRVLGVAVGDISDETSNQNLAAWDSLAHMNLILEVEATYGVSLSTEDAMGMTDVAAIKRVLRERGVGW